MAAPGPTAPGSTTPGSASPGSATPGSDTSTGELVSRLTEQVSTLVRDELRLAQAELSEKASHAGKGVGLFGAGGLLGFLGAAGLVTTAILALALVLPAWAAALVVSLALLASAGVAGLLGKKQVDQATPLTPERTKESVQQDVAQVKEGAHR